MSNYSIQLKSLFETAIKEFMESMKNQSIKELHIFELMGGESDVIFKGDDGSAQYGKIHKFNQYSSYPKFEIQLDDGLMEFIDVDIYCNSKLDIESLLNLIDRIQSSDLKDYIE